MIFLMIQILVEPFELFVGDLQARLEEALSINAKCKYILRSLDLFGNFALR